MTTLSLLAAKNLQHAGESQAGNVYGITSDPQSQWLFSDKSKQKIFLKSQGSLSLCQTSIIKNRNFYTFLVSPVLTVAKHLPATPEVK